MIASQDLTDGFFEKKVVYILEHNRNKGALGFAVNHPLRSIKVRALMDYLSLEEEGLEDDFLNRKLTLYQGGPANIEKAFILHSNRALLGSNKKKNREKQKKLSLVESAEELKSMLIHSTFDKHLFTFGYAGWSNAQLEQEIALGLWHIAPFDESIVFNDSEDDLWEVALNSININPNYLASGLGHA